MGDGADAGDHTRCGGRQRGRLAEERCAVVDGEEVRAEAVDLGEQAGLGGGGEAEHGHDRGDADRDPERGEGGAHAAGAKADACDPGEVGESQPGRLEVRLCAHLRASLMSANAARSPCVVAVTMYPPGALFAVNAGAIAMPFAFESTRTVRSPCGPAAFFPVSDDWFRER